jgi:hypothetical protein
VPPQMHSAARRPTRHTARRTSTWPRLLARGRPRHPGLDVERAVDETKGAPVLYQGRRGTTGSGGGTPSPSPISRAWQHARAPASGLPTTSPTRQRGSPPP